MIESSGVGIDIVEVDRFKKKKYEKNKIFYKKIGVVTTELMEQQFKPFL